MAKTISSIVVTGTDGQEYHHELDAEEANVTNNIHGFASLTYFLPRKLSVAHNDVGYFLSVNAYYGITPIFEGRIKSFERVIEEDREGFQITCEGWQAHLEDRKFVELYDDSSFADWEQWPNAEDNCVTDNNNRLYMAFPKGSQGGTADHAAMGCWALAGEKPIQLAQFTISASFNNSFFDGFIFRDTTPWANNQTSARSWSSTNQTLTAAPASAYTFITLRRNNNLTGTAAHWQKITDIHLTTVPGAFTFFPSWPTGYADEVIKYTASAYCPKLSTDYSNLDSPSADVFPLAMKDGNTALEVADAVTLVGDTSSGQWDWAIWDGQKIWLKQRNLSAAAYFTAMHDGMQGIPQADSDNLANEVRARYTDWKDRSHTYVTTDTGDTDSPLNVGAVSGTVKTYEMDLGYNATSAKAAQIAMIALSQVKYPLAQGTVTLTREPQDSAGNRVPLPLVRSGNLLRIRDFATSDAGFSVGTRTYGICDFYIVEASFDDEAGTLTLTLDNTSSLIEQALERLKWHTPAKVKKKKKKRR